LAGVYILVCRPVIKIGPKGALGIHEIRPIYSAPSLGQSIRAPFLNELKYTCFLFISDSNRNYDKCIAFFNSVQWFILLSFLFISDSDRNYINGFLTETSGRVHFTCFLFISDSNRNNYDFNSVQWFLLPVFFCSFQMKTTIMTTVWTCGIHMEGTNLVE